MGARSYDGAVKRVCLCKMVFSNLATQKVGVECRRTEEQLIKTQGVCGVSL